MLVQSTIQTGATVECEFDELPEVSRDALIRYGFQRWINDRTNSWKNSKKIEEPDALEHYANDMLGRLKEGIIGPQRANGSTRHPYIEVVVDMLVEKAKAAGKRLTKKAIKEAISEQGIDKFIAAVGGEDSIKAELERRKEAAAAIDNEALASLEDLGIEL